MNQIGLVTVVCTLTDNMANFVGDRKAHGRLTSGDLSNTSREQLAIL